MLWSTCSARSSRSGSTRPRPPRPRSSRRSDPRPRALGGEPLSMGSRSPGLRARAEGAPRPRLRRRPRDARYLSDHAILPGVEATPSRAGSRSAARSRSRCAAAARHAIGEGLARSGCLIAVGGRFSPGDRSAARAEADARRRRPRRRGRAPGRGGGRRGGSTLARGRLSRPPRLALSRSCVRRSRRLHRPGQDLRHQHRRRRSVRLRAALGGASPRT